MVQTQAAALRARLSLIDQDLHALEAKMRSLDVERATVARHLKAIVYPILSLPSEIVSEIFGHYVKDHHKRSPMRLTWICKSWRAIAISTCSLWTYFRYHSVNLIPLWLPRAGALGVDLYLASPSTPPTLMALLHPYFSTMRSISLGCAPFTLPINLSGSFCCLEKLCLHGGTLTSSTLMDAPQLREVTLYRGGVDVSQMTFPWIQITKLTLEALDLNDCMEVLGWTPNLEDLSLSVRSPAASSHPMLHLPRVHTLSVSCTSSSRVLDYLVLPALQHLAMELDPSENESEMLKQLIRRSGCVIRTLDLDAWWADTALLHHFFEEVPLASLRELTLRDPDGQDKGLETFFYMLMPQNSGLDSLEYLTIDGCQFQVSLIPLVDMLTSRTSHTTKFKKFAMLFGQGCGASRVNADLFDDELEASIESAVEKLQTMRADGLVVDIQTTAKWNSGSIFEMLHTL